MHEFSLATQIIESVQDFATAHQAERVLKVRLQVGELTCVAVEQLKFCYESIISGTLLAGSVLEIETVQPVVRCRDCGYEGSPKYWDAGLAEGRVPTLECPRCGKSVEALAGHECQIKSVQYVNATPVTTSA